jgi:O-antigen/teichoic acid export membrane protein
MFSGGVLVGGGVIQSVYTKANQIPDLNVAKILKLLGYLGLISLIILWITGVFLSNIIYGGYSINSAFTVKVIAAGFLLGLSIFVNLHVYNASKKQIPPNKTIMKIAMMSGRGLLVLILICAIIAFN